jgi:hypothetical protein
MHLCNICVLWDCTVLYPRKLSSSTCQNYSGTGNTFPLLTSIWIYTSRTSFLQHFPKNSSFNQPDFWHGYPVMIAYSSPEFSITKLQCKYPHSAPTDEFPLEVKYWIRFTRPQRRMDKLYTCIYYTAFFHASMQLYCPPAGCSCTT